MDSVAREIKIVVIIMIIKDIFFKNVFLLFLRRKKKSELQIRNRNSVPFSFHGFWSNYGESELAESGKEAAVCGPA